MDKVPSRIPSRMSAAEYQEYVKARAQNPSGGAWRGRVAKPTTRDGITFPSKIQAAVWSILRVPLTPTLHMIVREPILDLWSLAIDGKPARYRPDFLVLTSRGGIEFHEAKGSKSAESRDWRLRAAAALREYPFLPMYVWRYVGKAPRRFTLEEALRS